ncbi:MAG TPA: hypothetical protein PL151_11200 [Phycisphaerae bacterium]|nr:hypothetical protein [Phycisphaerae bacterium]HOJ74928.1 hypothetical protein [Phycisphaerae bacterium]HOM51489.1 hypothetical protein [Phycisphaerae bacterium]HON68012.1 hypothetical protein [Phycisphaerae bacterium]HOQ87253.1 hypothetical protein [Phycisphaerae bacterium]
MERSDEVLKRAADKIGVKALAAELKLSPALVYKWCQPFDPEDPDSSGTRNPLDRLAQIIELTGDVDLVNWVCHQAGGFFTPNPEVEQGRFRRDLLMGAQGLVKEFSDMLEEVSRAMADDGAITPTEAARIRKHWEVLKRVAEHFVVCAEAGLFHEEDA